MKSEVEPVLEMESGGMVGGMRQEEGDAPLPGAAWYVAEARGDGLVYSFAKGALGGAGWLTMDLLVAGDHQASFRLQLREGETGPAFQMMFHALNECQVRVRLPLAALNLGKHKLGREGGLLCPSSGGDRVDLGEVDRIALQIAYKSERPVRFCVTALKATAEEPAFLADPILPKGRLLDELGQSRLQEWPTKSRSEDEVTQRMEQQLAEAGEKRLPASFSQWGGWKELRFEGTGFFRTHHDGKRWWLVDPEGYAFWSVGLDCMMVGLTLSVCGGLEKALTWMSEKEGPYQRIYSEGREEGSFRQWSINYLIANLIRAFGPEEWHDKWMQIAIGQLKGLGFNTVGNWSDPKLARGSGLPYVIPLDRGMHGIPSVYRGFPDVFAPEFEEEAAEYAKQLEEFKDDPALVGYFLMNEPSWGFAQDTPAEGMLFNTPSCASRRALSEFLRERHGSDDGLSSAWRMDVTLAAVAEGEWRTRVTEAARADLTAFSTVMVEKLFTGLSEACRRVDPNHLNLGARPHAIPPDWQLAGMRSFDVFSINCYRPRIRPEFERLSAYVERPVIVGEWHFGALDAGLTCAGLACVRDQESRAKAYRVYLEDAAASPWCVGAQWFQMYDESLLGRFDGENYNFGFFDVCNRLYEPLGTAARETHERLYQVVAGEVAPYADAPEYLPTLYEPMK